MSFMLMLQAGFQANAANTVAKSVNTSLSVWDLTLKGGWVMIPIFLLSILAVYIFVERYFAIRKASIEDQSFMNRVREFIHDRKIEAAIRLSQSTNTPVSRMIEVGISRIGRPMADVNAAIENVGRLEIYKLERGLASLGAAAGAAPMLGFLGTVLGMIRAFYDMSMAGSTIDIGILSNGIYTAMVTTAAGLLVGIPAYFFYNILVSKIETVVFVLETRSSEFMDLLNEPAK
ncbi:MAG: MotA/TolQ/ExbB proton channel family protein [Porphyromonadaceae bacterium]|nr:MAG: MotA/TolQ/ExbB proton channel family protein [Porphyromonadaceae bacterium]